MEKNKQILFSCQKIDPLTMALNEKIKELYQSGGQCFIRIHNDEKMMGAGPRIEVSIADPGIRDDHNTQTVWPRKQ